MNVRRAFVSEMTNNLLFFALKFLHDTGHKHYSYRYIHVYLHIIRTHIMQSATFTVIARAHRKDKVRVCMWGMRSILVLVTCWIQVAISLKAFGHSESHLITINPSIRSCLNKMSGET